MALYIDKNGLKIEVKRKYAYHYNKAGSVVGRTELDGVGGLIYFVDLMYKAGFERDEEDYRKSLGKINRRLQKSAKTTMIEVPSLPLNPYPDEEPMMEEEK